MNCCDQERSTPYCPMCGKQLDQRPPLRGLLAHCRTQQNAGERQKRERSGRLAESAQRSINKWKAWGDQLQQLMESSDKP